MKKIAVKGICILGGIVLICLLFSGTVHNLTTAKVRMTSARSGRLERTLNLTGSLNWPDSVLNMSVPEAADGDTLTVLRVYAGAGSYVESGETVLECAVADYDAKLTSLEEEYAAKEKEYLELNRKYSHLVLTRQDENWIGSYNALKETRNRVRDARVALQIASRQAGVELTGDTVPETVQDGDVLQAAGDLKEAIAEMASAQENFDRVNRYPISDEIISWIEKRDELELAMDGLLQSVSHLKLLESNCRSVTAPNSGYISSMELKAGDTVSGKLPLFSMTAPEQLPVIRLTLDSNEKTDCRGLTVKLESKGREVERTAVSDGIADDGGRYADVLLEPGDIARLGGLEVLRETSSVSAKIVSTADSITTLIPSAAVRGSGNDRYIYTVQTAEDALGAGKMTVTRKNVTVIAESDTTVSVQESLNDMPIAYMEDRMLKEGCEVMQYNET